MTKIFVLLGSNLGNKMQNLNNAEMYINKQVGKIIKRSSVYESEAWGFECEQNFLNRVLIVESDLDAFTLLKTTQNIEKLVGRTAKTRKGYESRIIDVDILFYGDKIIDTEALTIPHKQIQNRKFTLLPLAEIAPDFIHPKLKKSIQTLFESCTDKGFVKKLQ